MPVLVIDPSADARNMVAEAVKWADGRHVVAMADDGASGWQQALRVKPELIICEPVLPDICGQELCRRLGSRLPESTFLAYGYDPGPETTGQFIFSGYLPKPPARTAVFTCLRNAKEQKRRFKLKIANDENLRHTRGDRDESPAEVISITMAIIGDTDLKFSIQIFKGATVGSVLRRTGKTNIEYFTLIRSGSEVDAILSTPINAGDTLLIRGTSAAKVRLAAKS
jgi:DNA-binding NarL/FixJ family response regulator